jgi:hypothetical protein
LGAEELPVWDADPPGPLVEAGLQLIRSIAPPISEAIILSNFSRCA